MNCLHCDTTTTNPKFCSKSCAASHNNSAKPKRKLKNKCYLCKVLIKYKLKYCKDCYQQTFSRGKLNGLSCSMCSNYLSGKQKKFCSTKCKGVQGNLNHQSYKAQKARGLKRKLELLKVAGGECFVCGYKKNISALVFHHLRPHDKSFNLDMRSLSNRKLDLIMKEFDKCELLCKNCHAEYHNPSLSTS